MSTGQKIKELREKKGMTQEQLASTLGYSHKSSINKIESGKADLPQSKLLEIAKFFGVSPCYLLEIEELNESWEKEYNENSKLQKEVQLIERIQEQYGKEAVRVLDMYLSLNKRGRSKAIETLEDLTSLPKYKEG